MKKLAYKIYQTSHREIRFTGLKRLSRFIPGLDALNELNVSDPEFEYTCVYESDIEVEESTSDFSVLNKLFETFNLNHPSDFKGHSLSVSDVVQINDINYYVDSFGFEKLNYKVDA